MARQVRIEYPGAWYHVTCRGNERKDIFLNDKDREKFVYLLIESSDIYKVEVNCYVLMNNHFHFLVHTPKGNLGRFMQRLNTAYTGYFNYRYKRSGHLFQGRYKGILIETDEYLLELSRYMHLNPVKIKRMSNKPLKEKVGILKEYRWSSFQAYLDNNKRSKYFRYLEVLDNMGGDNPVGIKKYMEYVSNGIEKGDEKLMEQVAGQIYLGGNSFGNWIKENFLKMKSRKEHPHLKVFDEETDIKKIAEVVARNYGTKKEEIIKRHSNERQARQMLIELSYQANAKTKKIGDIGKELGIGGDAVCQTHKRFTKKVENDIELREKFNIIKNELSEVKD